MAEQLEDIPTMSATERYIEIAKREDPNKWECAYALRDAVIERIGEDEGARARRGERGSGAHQAIAEIWGEAMDAGLVEHSIPTLELEYQTALAWPEETRVKGATYSAHRELRSLKNRQGRLSKWVAQTTTGYFGRDAARRKKSELGKPASERVEEARPPVRFRKNIHRALNRWAGPLGLSDAEKREAISILRDLIAEIEEGEV